MHRTPFDTVLMRNFCITCCLHETGNLCGIMDVYMKVPLTEDTYLAMWRILDTRLHFLLTHTDQEGVIEPSTFCDAAYRDVLRAVEEIGELFGEDAEVVLDRNVAFYQDAGMENLYRQRMTLQIGVDNEGRYVDDVAPHRIPGINAWGFAPLEEGWNMFL